MDRITSWNGTSLMKITTLTLALVVAAPGAAVNTAAAETLLINAIATEPANAPGALPRPTKGMSKAHVKGRFGAPAREYPPIGTPGSRHQPPITRWAYPQFTVYFENQHVINTVIHRTKR